MPMCPLCSSSVGLGELEAHLRLELRYAPFRCRLCLHSFPTSDDARHHFQGPFSPHPQRTPDILEKADRELEARLLRLLEAAGAQPLKPHCESCSCAKAQPRITAQCPSWESKPVLASQAAVSEAESKPSLSAPHPHSASQPLAKVPPSRQDSGRRHSDDPIPVSQLEPTFSVPSLESLSLSQRAEDASEEEEPEPKEHLLGSSHPSSAARGLTNESARSLAKSELGPQPQPPPPHVGEPAPKVKAGEVKLEAAETKPRLSADGRVACLLCGLGTPKHHFRQHVHSHHLSSDRFHCRHCQRSFKHRHHMDYHLRAAHQLPRDAPEAFQELNLKAEIAERVEECFGSVKEVSQQTKNCRSCRVPVKVNSVRSHVTEKHLDKPIHVCRLCNYISRKLPTGDIARHLRRSHAELLNDKTALDESAKHAPLVKKLVRQLFA